MHKDNLTVLVDFFFQASLNIMLCIWDLILWLIVPYSQETFSHIEEKKCNQFTCGDHYQSCPTTILFLPYVSCRSCKDLWNWNHGRALISITNHQKFNRPTNILNSHFKPGLLLGFFWQFSLPTQIYCNRNSEMESKKLKVQNAAPVILNSSQPMSSKLWPPGCFSCILLRKDAQWIKSYRCLRCLQEM